MVKKVKQIVKQKHISAGASGRSRTDDLRVTKPLLYQLSYAGTLSWTSLF